MALILHVGKLISNFKLCTTSWCAFRPADSSQILLLLSCKKSVMQRSEAKLF